MPQDVKHAVLHTSLQDVKSPWALCTNKPGNEKKKKNHSYTAHPVPAHVSSSSPKRTCCYLLPNKWVDITPSKYKKGMDG